MQMARLLLVLSRLCVLVSGETALLLIDVQDCFTTQGDRNGSLSVQDAIDIVPVINNIRQQKGCLFDHVFLSQDYHPLQHISFASTHGISFTDDFSINAGTNTIALKCLATQSGSTSDASCCLVDEAACLDHGCTCDNNPACASNADNAACNTCAVDSPPEECFDMTQALWPDHCGSWSSSEAGNDAAIVSSLERDGDEIIVQKGGNQLVDAYSAFMDNTKTLRTELHSELQSRNVDTLFVAGIATDFCVEWTVNDAIELGYTVHFISDASKGIVRQAVQVQQSVNGTVNTVTSEDILAMDCPASTSRPASVDVDNAFSEKLHFVFFLAFAHVLVVS